MAGGLASLDLTSQLHQRGKSRCLLPNLVQHPWYGSRSQRQERRDLLRLRLDVARTVPLGWIRQGIARLFSRKRIRGLVSDATLILYLELKPHELADIQMLVRCLYHLLQ